VKASTLAQSLRSLYFMLQLPRTGIRERKEGRREVSRRSVAKLQRCQIEKNGNGQEKWAALLPFALQLLQTHAVPLRKVGEWEKQIFQNLHSKEAKVGASSKGEFTRAKANVLAQSLRSLHFTTSK
jgi:hypothetical protein